MWRLCQMLPVSWDLAHTSKMNGSAGRGAPPSAINQSLIKSYSLLWLPRTFGVHNGTDAMSCSARTTRQWCTFLRPGRRKSRALCSFCAIYCRRQLDIILPLQLYICLAFITRLLMLSLISIGRSFGVWRPRLYHTLLQFLNSYGIF